MSNRAAEIAGQRFGKLVAIERSHTGHGGWRWLCRCDCGNTTKVAVFNLRNGHTKSCGCLSGGATHRQSYTPLHRRWRQIRSRCNNVNDRRYHDYGGRGISYAPEWDDFETFRRWAESAGYRQELQIDRIDNDADYSPENCRWVDRETNMNNRRNSRRVVVDGEALSFSQASRRLGIDWGTIARRVKGGQLQGA